MTAAEASLTVGIWQDSGSLGDVATNLATISRVTAQASQRGVQFLIFPECFLTGYFNREDVEADRSPSRPANGLRAASHRQKQWDCHFGRIL